MQKILRKKVMFVIRKMKNDVFCIRFQLGQRLEKNIIIKTFYGSCVILVIVK